MKLHSTAFERALKREVRQAVASAPSLKREYRAARKIHKQYQLAALVRPGLSLLVPVAGWLLAEQTGNAEAALAVVTLYGLAFSFIHAADLLARLYRSADLPALMLLPLPDGLLFRWELQKFWKVSFWTLLGMLGGYASVAIESGVSPAACLGAVLMAGLAWAIVIALAVLAVAYAPRWPYHWAAPGLFMGSLGLFWAKDYVAGPILALLIRYGSEINLLVPTGWPASLSQIWLAGSSLAYLVLLIPIGALIQTLKPSLTRLRNSYRFAEAVRTEGPDLLFGTAAEVAGTHVPDESEQPRLDENAIEDLVLSRQFLAAPRGLELGAFERGLWRLLNSRERRLSEFVFPDGIAIGGPWEKIYRNLAVLCLAAYGLNLVDPASGRWVLGIGLFVIGCQTLNRIITPGRAFYWIRNSGVNVPLYAGYGIGYRELGWLLLKCSLVQIPLLIPVTVAGSLATSYLLNLSLVSGAVFGLKTAGLVFMSRIIFLTLSFSSGTNDTSRLRLWSVLVLLLIIVCGLGFAALSAGSLLIANPWIAWALWLAAGLDAYLLFCLYGWLYNANRFDLISLPRG